MHAMVMCIRGLHDEPGFTTIVKEPLLPGILFVQVVLDDSEEIVYSIGFTNQPLAFLLIASILSQPDGYPVSRILIILGVESRMAVNRSAPSISGRGLDSSLQVRVSSRLLRGLTLYHL
jgi:hypothetical protein